ncbi:DUF4194 domain-containing protein [Xylanimonas protaetiae]|uniref:DUF4194 domain-containing protein n=1 Tax=Xylanimonas protaetiae TaxID=2509457 RepID=A0A4P6F759_9MICO|nr:DUF4194 domain-containing protein [Xylanimonas protaetiae]QAY71514.1 DUF4194 domain-containing protein [Xylanimonas protaetiae]
MTTDDPGFIEPVPMEADPAALFAGDTGTLDAEARRVLVNLLRRRYLRADANPAQWKALIAHQAVIESRLHDLFVRLVVDHDRGLAYKRQVRTAETEVPVLLRDEAYSRIETILLVHLRTVFQREQGAGERSARLDAEELEQTALTYLDPHETNQAALQREIRAAVARLVKEGFLEEESEGRYRVTPLVEVVLSVERLGELLAWLRSGAHLAAASVGAPAGAPAGAAADDEEDDE